MELPLPLIVLSVDPFDIDPDVPVVASFLPAAAFVPEVGETAPGATPVVVGVLPPLPMVDSLDVVPVAVPPLPVVTGEVCAAASDGAMIDSAKMPAMNLEETLCTGFS